MKGAKRQIAKLEEKLRAVEQELDIEQRRHAEAQKNVRKCDRRVKELSFQAEEDRKNQEKMQDLVEKLQQKIRTYKRQIEEAVSIFFLFFCGWFLWKRKLIFFLPTGGNRCPQSGKVQQSAARIGRCE